MRLTKPAATLNVALLAMGIMGLVVMAGIRLWDYGYGSDSAGMLEQIHDFLGSGQYDAIHFPPGFGILAYPFYLITDSIPFSGVLLSYTSYLWVVVCSYLLCRLCQLNIAPSMLVAFIVGLNPILYTQSNVALSEVLYAAQLFLVAYLFLKLWYCPDKSGRIAFGIGLVFSISYLMRAEVLGCIGISLLAWILSAQGWSLKRRLKPVIIILGLVVITVGVYAGYLYSKLDIITITGKTDDVFFNYGGSMDERIATRFGLPDINPSDTVFGYVLKNPVVFLLRLIYNTADMTVKLFSILSYVLIPGAAMGMIMWLRKRKTTSARLAGGASGLPVYAGPLSVFVVVVMPMIFLLPFYLTDRFLVPYSAGLSFIFGYGLAVFFRARWQILLLALMVGISAIWHPYSWLPKGKIAYHHIEVTALDFLGLYSNAFSIRSAHAKEHASLPYKKAATWLSQHVSLNKDIKIGSQKKGHVILAFLNPRQPRNQNGMYLNLWGKNEAQMLSDIESVLKAHVDYVVLNRHYTRGALLEDVLNASTKAERQIDLCHYREQDGYMIIALIDACPATLT